MWRMAGLLLSIAALAAMACGGAAKAPTISTSTPETGGPVSCSDVVRGSTFEPYIQASFDEASEMIGFEILQPQGLPADATLFGPFVLRSGLCPEDVVTVELMVRGQGHTMIVIDESRADPADADLPEAIEINGVQGSIRREEREDGLAITVAWSDEKRRFTANLLPGSELSEGQFLEILESIPDS